MPGGLARLSACAEYLLLRTQSVAESASIDYLDLYWRYNLGTIPVSDGYGNTREYRILVYMDRGRSRPQ